MPLITTLAGAAARAYGLLAKSLSFFVSAGSSGFFQSGFRVNTNQDTWSSTFALDYSFAYLHKTTNSLEPVFQKKLTSSNITQLYDMALDSSDNLYLAGYDGTYGWLAKLANDGSITWQRQITGGISRVASASNALYVYGLGGTKLIKYNTSGSITDSSIYSYSSNNLDIYNLAIDSSDNVYIRSQFVVGSSGTFGGITKLNSSGAVQWQKTFPTNVGNGDGAITTDSSGNLYIVTNADNTSSATLIIKLNSSGAIQWQKQLDYSTLSPAIFVDNNDLSVYFSTSTIITKLDSSGNQVFTNSVNNFQGIKSIYVNGSDLYFGNGSQSMRTKSDGSERRTITLSGNAYYMQSTSYAISSSSITLGTPYTYTKSSSSTTDTTGTWSITSNSDTYLNDAI